MPWSHRPRIGLLVGVALGLSLPGCKAKPQPAPAPTRTPSAHPSAAPPAPERCREVGPGPSLTVGEAERAPRAAAEDADAGDEEEDQAELPFAARVEAAVALGSEFAMGGLSTQGGKTEAFVALVPFDGKPGRRVGLGPVHGDVDPPLVAGRAASLLVATADMDAGGGMLRLTRLPAGADKTSGELSITGVDHDAGAALAEGEHGALLVWGAASKHGVALKALGVDPETLAGPGPALDLKGTLGAESPVLLARPGGYWLAWVSEEPLADAGAHRDAGVHAGLAARGAAGLSKDGGASEEVGSLLDAGPRTLLALPLDGAGKPLAAPRAVSARARVVGFAAALSADGALALTWRNDEASPGVENGPPELARVALDGAVLRGKMDDEELTAGTPALVADPKAGGRVWVGLESASEGTRVGLLAASGLGLEALTGDRLLRGAELLAAGEGKLLVGRSRGRAVELEVLECKPSP